MPSYKDVINGYAQEAYAAYESISGQTLLRNPDGAFSGQGHNDALDAFRHAYTSAAFAQDYGTAASHLAGELNEIKGDYRKNQPPKEHNMDDWNNSEGRNIGLNTTTRQEITDAVWDALNNGELIVDPNDPRDYRSFDEQLSDGINDLWNQFKDWFLPRLYDPLALDLDGDGIETIGADGSVLFDLDGDGIKNGTGWVSADDGFLVLDRDGNNTIDTGAELFGVDTVKSDGNKATDGFDALSDLDTNTDGLFDQNDIEFANVQVWQDLNQDGISTENELSSLNDLGIVSIDLNSDSNNVNLGNGNVQSATSAHLTQEGVEGETSNLDLASNPFYREFTDSIELSEQALSLPDAVASGLVRDLREAVTLSPELGTLLDDFSSDTSYQGQHAKLDALFTAWAETSTMESSVQAAEQEGYSIFYLRPDESEETYDQHLIYWNDTNSSILPLNPDEIELFETLRERQQEVTNLISTLERFNGEGFVEVEADRIINGAGIPSFVSSNVGSDGVERDRVFVFLSDQQIDFMLKGYNRLKESVYGSLVVQTRLSEYLDAIHLDINEGGQLFIDYSEMNTLLDNKRIENSTEALADLIELNRYSGQSLHRNNWDGLEKLQNWINEDGPGTSEVLGDLNVNLVDGVFYTDSDTINSIVFGGVGDDTLSGDQLEANNETLLGGGGNDNIYGQAGNDVIFGNTGNDNLAGGVGNDILDGGDGNDNLDGGEGSDLLRGGAGDDSLFSGNSGLSDLDGNNDLFGGSGNDYLTGGAGNDLLDGGTGNDTLEGWDGVDTFVFNRGDGQDTIIDDGDGSADDKIVFGAGITSEHLRLRRDTSILIIEILDDQGALTGGSLTIQDAFWDSPEFLMGSFEFSDGSTMTAEEISAAAAALVGTDGDDVLSGDFDVDIIKGLAGNDTLTSWSDGATLLGGEGNDTLLSYDGNASLNGGAGDDTLTGSWGNDVLEGGSGNDILEGGGGADTYVFNVGDGQDTITDDANGSADDKIVFGTGITTEHLQFRRDNNTLHIELLDDQGMLTGDAIAVEGAFWDSPEYVMGSFEFSDGSTMTTEEISAVASALIGTGGDDVIMGGFDGDTIKGLAGNDILSSDGGDATLLGGEGNDTLLSYDGNASLNGGAGDDTLTGSWGDDVLEGGQGNDTLAGGGGADTYVFNLGDGQDTIIDDAYDSNQSTLQLGTGFTQDNTWFSQDNDDLLIQRVGSTDQIRVAEWFMFDELQIGQINTDEATLLNNQVANLVSAMAGYAVPSGVDGVIPQDVMDDLAPTIAASWA